MQFSEAFKQVAKDRGYSIPAIAEEAGVKYGSLASILVKGNPTVDTMNRYLAVLGYEVVLAPVGTKLPSGCHVIEAGESK